MSTKVSDAKLAALAKARAVRAANIKARKEGKEVPKKPEKPPIRLTTNKKGNIVSAARHKAGKINVSKRLDRMGHTKKEQRYEMEHTVEKALKSLKGLKNVEIEKAEPITRKKKKQNMEIIVYKPTKEQEKKYDRFALDYIEDLHEISRGIIHCTTNYSKENFSNTEKEKCKTEMIYTLTKLIEIVQSTEEFKRHANDASDPIKELLIDSIIDLFKELTGFATIYFSSLV